jgi:hypothetical protein
MAEAFDLSNETGSAAVVGLFGSAPKTRRALASVITVTGVVLYYLYAFHPRFWPRCRERLTPNVRHWM